jgi:hypothetical protein
VKPLASPANFIILGLLRLKNLDLRTGSSCLCAAIGNNYGTCHQILNTANTGDLQLEDPAIGAVKDLCYQLVTIGVVLLGLAVISA